MRQPHRRVVLSLLLLLLPWPFVGCAAHDQRPAIAELYRSYAQRQTRNPVVVVHGILGARLHQQSTGKTVWGAFTSEGIDPQSPDGARALALPLRAPERAADYDPAREDVHAAGPLDALKLTFLFTVLNVQVYAEILRSLGVGGYTDPVLLDPGVPAYAEDHFTCYTFFYDWRRDNVENALQLDRYLKQLRVDIERRARGRIARLREQAAARPTDAAAQRAEAAAVEQWLADGFRFDVVAHSMGGLIARYYLRYGATDLPADGALPEVTWAGAGEIDRLIVVGTPNLGAMEAVQNLVDGYTPSLFLPHFDAAVLGTMPSIYQLMPRNAPGLFRARGGDEVAIDLYDPAVWQRHGWGLADPRSDRVLAWLLPDVASAAERRRIAGEYQAWCLDRARRFHAAIDRDAPPGPAEVRLFAGDTIPTLGRAQLVDQGDGRYRPLFVGASLQLPGDGTVARYSAIADRAFGVTAGQWLDTPVDWTSVTFLPDDHIGLTRNPVFTDNLLFQLLAQRPRPRAAGGTWTLP